MTDLLLLHGAIGSKDQFALLAEKLGRDFTVHTLNFSGHGDAEMKSDFSIEAFAEEVLHYMESTNLKEANIFGYSMGGYVALYLARKCPERVSKIFTLATKFLWTPEISQRETRMLDAARIAEKIPVFANELEKRHRADWRIVLQKTAGMLVEMGKKNPLTIEDYKTIEIPIRVSVGDKDMMVTLEETIAVYRNLPNATLLVLPDTQHPIEKIDIDRLSAEISNFFG